MFFFLYLVLGAGRAQYMVGVAKWVGLGGVLIHLDPFWTPSIVFPLFPKMHYVTNVRKKNQTSKVSLCGKRTGSTKIAT